MNMPFVFYTSVILALHYIELEQGIHYVENREHRGRPGHLHDCEVATAMDEGRN